VPNPGVGGHGVASEFGDLTGLTRQAVSEFLCSLGASVKTTQGGYVEYKFTDRSKVIIRPDGEIVRIPAPRYVSVYFNFQRIAKDITWSGSAAPNNV
jgi:hypothetical protein